MTLVICIQQYYMVYEYDSYFKFTDTYSTDKENIPAMHQDKNTVTIETFIFIMISVCKENKE